MENNFDITAKKPGDVAWGVFKRAITDPPEALKISASVPVKGRLLHNEDRTAIACFMPFEPVHQGPMCYEAYDINNWILSDDEDTAWGLRKVFIFDEIAGHKDAIVRLDGLLSMEPRRPLSGPQSRFKCRALSGNWCQKWQRACVGWESCGIKASHGAPCPCCISSSPLDAPGCADCRHAGWKQENYDAEPGSGTDGAGHDDKED